MSSPITETPLLYLPVSFNTALQDNQDPDWVTTAAPFLSVCQISASSHPCTPPAAAQAGSINEPVNCTKVTIPVCKSCQQLPPGTEEQHLVERNLKK